ncbi:hypothetical protein HK16_04565 [Acetobacter senegalensis]|uniref:Uncharacterized protein n=2 Tax=Acetobacter TaxID=434 RepID=A0A252EE11_9PROT|nr:hypothetical protein CIW82_00050 [Acetobacter tropicalis]OUL64532.1 hypothetical protein HK16_04565 [Acetobacter senegalensis]
MNVRAYCQHLLELLMAVFEVTMQDDDALEHVMGRRISSKQFEEEKPFKGHQGSELDGGVQEIVRERTRVKTREMRHEGSPDVSR